MGIVPQCPHAHRETARRGAGRADTKGGPLCGQVLCSTVEEPAPQDQQNPMTEEARLRMHMSMEELVLRRAPCCCTLFVWSIPVWNLRCLAAVTATCVPCGLC